MHSFLHDLRLGARRLRRSPAFTLTAVGLLACGMGTSLAVYQALYDQLLRPLPLTDADRILQVRTVNDRDGSEQTAVSPALWTALRNTTAVEHAAAVAPTGANLWSGDGYPERVAGMRLSAEFFDVFQLTPVTGSRFEETHYADGGPAVVMLTERLWTRRFDRADDIVGGTLQLDGVTHEIVGVLPAATQVLDPDLDIALPLRIGGSQLANRTPYLGVFAKFPPGPLPAAELDRIASETSTADAAFTIRPSSLREVHAPGARERFGLLLGAVVLALLVVCFNVGNLVLSRALEQTRSLVVRQVLGASPRDLFRNVLSETAVLVSSATLLAVAVALALDRVFQRIAPGTVRATGDLSSTNRIPDLFLGTLAPALILIPLVTLAVGTLPALRAVTDAGRSLRAKATLDRSSSRARSAFTAAQMAVTVVLVLAASLVLQSLLRAARSDLGFDSRQAVTAQFNLPRADYPDIERVRDGFGAIVEAVQTMPEVAEAAALSRVPLAGSSTSANFMPVTETSLNETDPAPTNVALRIMSAGAVRTLGLRLLAGRDFTDADRSGAPPVVLVNSSFARALIGPEAPASSAIGRRVFSRNSAFREAEDQPRVYEIVGVVGDVRAGGLLAPVRPEVTFPLAQAPADPLGWTGNSMMIAAVPSPSASGTVAAQALRRAAAGVDPNLPLFDVATLDQRLDASLADQRFAARLVSGLGLFTLTLAAAGIYALASFLVRSRRRELGLRLALGATDRRLVREATASSVRPAAWGLGLGLVLGIVLLRLASAQLPGVAGLSLGSGFGAVALLSAAALLASWWPSRRISTLEPSTILRAD